MVTNDEQRAYVQRNCSHITHACTVNKLKNTKKYEKKTNKIYVNHPNEEYMAPRYWRRNNLRVCVGLCERVENKLLSDFFVFICDFFRLWYSFVCLCLSVYTTFIEFKFKPRNDVKQFKVF